MARQPDIQYIRLYTDGSAARKLESVAPVKKAKLPRAKKQKRIIVHIDPVAILGILTAVVMLIVMAVSVSELKAAQQSTAAMEQYVDELRVQNEALRAEYESGYDITVVERTALALGMVPKEQVQQVSLQVSVPVETPAQVGPWDQFCAFLASLFA